MRTIGRLLQKTTLGMVIIGLAFLLTACPKKPKPGLLFGTSRVLTPDDYKEVLDTWSREAKVYRGLDTQMFVTATFHAPEFRRVFQLAFPDIYGHGGEVTRRELVDLSQDIENYFNFFVSVYTAEEQWNDLDQPDSIWRLSLEGEDDVKVSPSQIIPVKIDANLESVYPYIGHFDQVYLIRFKLADPMNRLVVTPASKFFRLKIVSTLGKAELTWDLVPARSAENPGSSDSMVQALP